MLSDRPKNVGVPNPQLFCILDIQKRELHVARCLAVPGGGTRHENLPQKTCKLGLEFCKVGLEFFFLKVLGTLHLIVMQDWPQ